MFDRGASIGGSVRALVLSVRGQSAWSCDGHQSRARNSPLDFGLGCRKILILGAFLMSVFVPSGTRGGGLRTFGTLTFGVVDLE